MLYLAYGSNLHPERLRERVPSAKLLGKTVIADRVLRFHKRSIIDGSAKCNIVAAAGTIHGAIYEISPDEKPGLDRVEGLGIGYRVETLNIAGYGDCYTYTATDTHVDDTLQPYSWYKELVMVGCETLLFPQPYLDGIAAVVSPQDPDTARHATQMQLVHRLRNGGRQ